MYPVSPDIFDDQVYSAADNSSNASNCEDDDLSTTSSAPSSSTSFNRPFDGNFQFTIRCRKDTAGKCLSRVSNFRREHEVLFPPNTPFFVMSRRSIVEKDGYRVHLVELQEMADS